MQEESTDHVVNESSGLVKKLGFVSCLAATAVLGGFASSSVMCDMTGSNSPGFLGEITHLFRDHYISFLVGAFLGAYMGYKLWDMGETGPNNIPYEPEPFNEDTDNSRY